MMLRARRGVSRHRQGGTSRPAWTLLAAWCALTAAGSRAQQPAIANPTLPVLTRVEQIRSLTPDEARLGYPVRLHAVVTYSDPSNADLYVEDSSGAIYVDPRQLEAGYRPGQYVEVQGIASLGDFANQINLPRIRILGEVPLPRAKRLSGDELASGKHDCQWVEVEGTVRSTTEIQGRLRLSLGSGSTVFVADVLHSQPPLLSGKLAGAKVRLRGVSSGIYNPKSQFIGAALMVPDLACLRVLKSPPADPFSIRVWPIHFLMRSTPEGAFNRPVRVQGVVTCQRPGQFFYLQDGSDAVRIETHQINRVSLGDLIDAVGFPSVGEYTPVMQDAQFRTIRSGPSPSPTPTKADALGRGEHDAELVFLDARLVDRTLRGRTPVLVMQAGNVIFDAEVGDAQTERRLTSIRLGSRLRLTGICAANVDENHVANGFRLLLRSPEDVTVIERPPLLTLRFAAWGLGMLGVGIVAALLWVWVLRRRVQQHTQVIAEQLRREKILRDRYQELFENANDVIFTLDLTGRFTSLNKAGERLSGYVWSEAVKMTAAQMVAPEYVRTVQRQVARAAAGEVVGAFEVEHVTKDQRRLWLEVSVRPIRHDERIVGLQAIARDFTERKRAEEAICRSNEMLQAIINASPVAINMISREGKLQIWNPAAERTFGWAQAEVLGRPNPAIPSDRTAEFRNLLEQVLNGGGIKGIDVRRLKKDGTLLDVSVSAAPIRDHQGNVVAAVALLEDITERKRAEEALRESEEHFRSLFENMLNGFAYCRMHYEQNRPQDFTYLQVNRAFEALTGLKNVVGKRVSEVIPGIREADPDLLEVYSRVASTGVPEQLEIYVKALEMWFSISVYSPRREYFVAVFDVITERKRAEEALKESEGRFRSLVENATVGIYRTTPDGRIVMANPTLVRMTGYASLEELASRNLEVEGFERAYPRREFTAEMERAGEIRGLEVAWTKRDGSAMFVRESTSAVRGEDGRILFYDGIVEDITERKRAEEALRESEERTRTIIETAYDAFVASDQRGLITDWNGQAEELFGWSRAEAIGRPVAETIIPLKYRLAHGQGMKRFWESGEGHVLNKRIEVVALRRDGREFPAEMTISPVHLGPRVLFSAFIHDITERKRAEAELRGAKEAAEAATRAKSEFLANMSHEIRTPMNGILGMAELALDTDLSSEQREYVEMVKISADALLKVINDILDFSKIEAGRFELESIEFDLAGMVSDTVKTLALRAHQKQLGLACVIEPNLPDRILGDPTRLRQVLINLAGNAIKFTDQGEIVVRVEKESGSRGEMTLHFSVADTGIGIPPDKQQLIFEAFTQVDASMTRRFGGTGLGLTISSQLVKMMGGRLWVESEPGRGSTFHFTARLGLPATAATKPSPQKYDVLRNLRVLVADDSATNRHILEGTLKKWEMEPQLVNGGAAALAALRDAKQAGNPFPVVLTDAHMPDLDGFALAERIRQDPALTGAIIMMVTSAGQPGEVGRCRELGIACCLTKPIGQTELLDALVATLDNHGDMKGCRRFVARQPKREAGHELHILLAEDNAVNRELAMRLLTKRGHRVTTATTGKQVLEMLEGPPEGKFDLILMDVQMPEMDGLQVTAAIRARENGNGKHLPIIAMTAMSMAGDRERCLAGGVDAYVAKPIEARELFATIESFALRDGASSGAENDGADAGAPSAVSALLSGVGGDTQLLGELAEIFIRESPRMMENIRSAVQAEDSRLLERAAHALKGSVGNFAAPAAIEAAFALEKIGRSGDLAQVGPALRRLEDEIARLTGTLSSVPSKGIPSES